MIGLSAELCSEEGFTWQARHLMFDTLLKTQGDAFKKNPMFQAYGYSAQNAAAAPAKMISILQALSARLHKQNRAGSRYFVGNQLTALDLYWANMSQIIAPYPPEKNPMPDFFPQFWAPVRTAVESAIDPILIEHEILFLRSISLCHLISDRGSLSVATERTHNGRAVSYLWRRTLPLLGEGSFVLPL